LARVLSPWAERASGNHRGGDHADARNDQRLFQSRAEGAVGGFDDLILDVAPGALSGSDATSIELSSLRGPRRTHETSKALLDHERADRHEGDSDQSEPE
jgi:hypothetical protein